MNRDKHSKKHNNNWKNSSRKEDSSYSKQSMHSSKAVSQEQIKADDEAIRLFKTSNQPLCARCNTPIIDMSQAMTDRGTGNPIHFDCALEAISNEEKLEEGDKITYIGQGRFGIVNFANPHDMKHFTIKKIIEWEDKEKKAEWRDEMAELYSHIK